MPEILEIRGAIRKEKLAIREAMPAHLRLAASLEIASQLLAEIDREGWRIIHTYLAFRSEVSTNPVIEQLLERERKVGGPSKVGVPSKVAVPPKVGVPSTTGLASKVIVPWVEENGELSHHELLGLDGLSDGPYGVPHPARNEYVALDKIDAVLVPLSAFDRSGNRLGYGKGFYDRFLATLPDSTRRIGLAFAIQEAESIPAIEHDQRLDMIVTERELITISQ